jgi:hypothetical protein
MRHTLFILFLFFVGSSCAQEKFILVGTGGGLTGSVTVYKITSKGKVFKGQGTTEIKYSERGKIKKALAKKFIQRVADQTTVTPAFNHPGNMYSFISKVEEGTEKKITWGDIGHPAPEQVSKLYQEIMASVGAIRYKPIKD